MVPLRGDLRRGRSAALLALIVLLSLACGSLDDDPEATGEGAEPQDEGAEEAPDEPDGDAEDEQADDPEPESDLRVVATLAPLADIVEQVLGDRGDVETLIPAGTDSHNYEPRPGDVAPLAEADVYFGIGLALNEAAVDLAEANLPEGAPLVLLGEETLAESDLRFDHSHDHSHNDHDDNDHDHSHDHNDHDDNDHDHSHDHDDEDEQPNPHVWTSVSNMQALTAGIASTLSNVDPDGGEGYEERAEDYIAELAALDEAIQDGVESIPEDARRLVVYHDAWTYFGDDYGVEVTAAVQPSDFSEPSASDVRTIIDLVREEEVPALFGSEEFPNDVVVTIADETGATYVGDLADDVLPGEPGDPEHSYVGMMATNVAKIVDALGGDPSPLEALGG